MPFAVLILVCAASMARADCQPSTARAVVQGPEVANELQCGREPQQFIARTAIARTLAEGEWIKITCRRTGIGSANVG